MALNPLDVAGAVGNVLSGVGQTAIGAWSAKKNYELQKEAQQKNLQFQMDNLNYQKDLQKKIFEREDSAVQRTVEDNKKAGLSPLAGIAGAGAGTAIATEAPSISDVPQFDASLLQSGVAALGNSASALPAMEIQRNSSELNKLNIESQIAQRKLDMDLQQKYGEKRAQTEIDLLEAQKGKIDSDMAFQEWNKEFQSSRFMWDKIKDNRDWKRVVENDVVDNALKTAQKANLDSAISSRALSDKILELNGKLLEMNVNDQTALDGIIRPAVDDLIHMFNKKANVTDEARNFWTMVIKNVLLKSPDLISKLGGK